MSDSPVRTKSWWGVFVSLLASIALAVAMVAVPTPAQAQDSLSGVARGNNLPTGYPITKVGDPNRYTSAVIWIKIGDEEYAAYCIEGKLGGRPEGGEVGQVVRWEKYRSNKAGKENLLSGDRYSQQRQEKLSWIAYNSYPYKSVEELSEILRIPDLNKPDVVAATQAAVNHYSDGFEFKFGSRHNSKLVYDYLTGPSNVGKNAKDLPGIGGLPFQNGKQDVILIPHDSEGDPSPTVETSTTNQVPPTQPSSPTTSTKPSDSTEETTTTTTETSTSPAPQDPEEGVRIRTQASFDENEIVQRISGKAPSDNIYDFVEIDNLPPGYYHLKTISFEAFPSGATKRHGDENYEFTITPDGRSIPNDTRDVFTITDSNPDGTFNGYIYTYEDHAKEVTEEEAAAGGYLYLSQSLKRKDLNEKNRPDGEWEWVTAQDELVYEPDEEDYIAHDGRKYPSQQVFPHQKMRTSASFVDGKFDNNRVDYVEIPEGGEAPAYVFDKVYFSQLTPGILSLIHI